MADFIPTSHAQTLFGNNDEPLIPNDQVKIIVPNAPKMYELLYPDFMKDSKQFGSLLERNKKTLNKAIDGVHVSPERRALLIAMAMQETNCMSERERDWTKDKSGAAANFSIFNLCGDMIEHVTGKPAAASMNALSHLDVMIKIINRAIDMTHKEWMLNPRDLGVRGVLNFVRGGQKTFIDGTTYQAGLYRRAIKTIVNRFDGNPALMHDKQRVWIDVPWV